MTVRVQREDFDLGAEVKRLTAGRVDVGAVATFTGLCRGRTGSDTVGAMTLETYEAMALAELQRIEEEARGRWPLADVLVVHRYGRMEPGDNIVLVVALSEHRQAAFAAAEFIMDFLKTRAPFWKFEETGGEGGWVAAKDVDDAAADRWSQD
ncbi:molybdenum cofactor biosynthesis protein MoaE [Phreatobacter cathodiphilus]|uniref:Molybdopterin synthase catalytic subunit n=1 Tax=Phreatobacter cathodiphilus TaxID=1868589 RepID=A0A2S0NBZ5_9HYPH|nr:molybdenum cofactor biosynthesis protein MoaE [Phreatobacter cathodiphilus]AVO45655.1 molybdenum cofactor biosynthesis protein MoaE [Phreatobacter cathodiphilus]